jgi:hypothetical protein
MVEQTFNFRTPVAHEKEGNFLRRHCNAPFHAIHCTPSATRDGVYSTIMSYLARHDARPASFAAGADL